MRTQPLRPMLLASALLMSGMSLASEINWAKSFDAAKTEAAKRHSLVMADFYTDW